MVILEDRERCRQPKKFENAELEAILKENPCQTQEELADAIRVDQSIVAKRLKAMGMLSKQ